MKHQNLLFSIIFAIFFIDFGITIVMKSDKLEKAKQLFRNVLQPNKVEEISYRLQKLKSLQTKNLKPSVNSISSASVLNKFVGTTKSMAKNGKNVFELDQMPNEINDNLGLDDILYGSDILLTTQQLDHLIAAEEGNQNSNGGGREKRQAIGVNNMTNYKIFDKTKPIYYTFNESFSNPAHRQTFREAMDYLNAYSCLNITEGFSRNLPQQVHVISESGCWSNLGYLNYSDGQQLSIGNGCERCSTMCHEMGHALGFHHTQNRHDRDKYIRLLMYPGDQNYLQYKKVSEYENNNFGLPYDLGSTMHYGSTHNGAMQTIDKTMGYSIGARDKFSFIDFKMLNALYSCQESCPTGPECKNQGFRNPNNCNACVCPRGFEGSDCSVPQFTQYTNETCGGILTAQSSLQTLNGSLNSYSTSASTQNLSACYWHIQAPEGKIVRVKFNSYSGSESVAPCYLFGLEVRTKNFETVGARVCRPDMINPTLEYVASSNLAIVAAFTKYYAINFSFSYWFTDPEITTLPPPTTVDTRPFTPLNCSGAMDLAFVIDASDTMTAERLAIVKSQLITAIDENGIKWDRYDYETARVAIVLTAGLFPEAPATPIRYNDLKGCPNGYFSHSYCKSTVFFTNDLKKTINDVPFDGGKNDIARSMTLTLKGEYQNDYYTFGDPIFWVSDIPNAMIVISGADTSNVTKPLKQLQAYGVQVFSIGFEDLPIAQLHAISGNPARAFSTSPGNLANTIKKICSGIYESSSTTTLPLSTSPSTKTTKPTTTTTPPLITTTITTTTTPQTTTKITTTTAKPAPFTPLNCSGAMDLVFVIDASYTMTYERLEIVKSQLITAFSQNGIRWETNDNNTARTGIILTASFFDAQGTTPHRYVDFKGNVDNMYSYDRTITFSRHLQQTFRDIVFYGGTNDIGLSMTLSLFGDNNTPNAYFGEALYGGEGDRPNVPNAMIVITGFDNSNVSLASSQLRNAGVQIFSIGFNDLPTAQLQAISGNPATAFSTTPDNVANVIKQICSGV